MKKIIAQHISFFCVVSLFFPYLSYAQTVTSVTVVPNVTSLAAMIQALEAQVKTLAEQIAALSSANLSPIILEVTGSTRLTISQPGAWLVRAFDPEGSRISYNVNWGDGSIELASGGGGSSAQNIQEMRFIHTYDRASTYPLIVTAIDESGALTNQSMNVTVEDPTANNNPPLFTGWPTSPFHATVGSANELFWFASDIDKGDRDFLNISLALKEWTGSKLLPFSTESMECPKLRVGETLFCQKFKWLTSGTVTLIATVEDPLGARFSEELKVVIEN